MAVLGRTIGQELCAALGLDASKVNRLVIDIPATEVATVDVTLFPDIEQGVTMTTAFARLVDAPDAPTITKRYHLVDMTPPVEE